MEANECCPRCGAGRMRGWRQLTEEEQEVVRRLPGTSLYTFAERVAFHRWCPRCWHEGTRAEMREA